MLAIGIHNPITAHVCERRGREKGGEGEKRREGREEEEVREEGEEGRT